MNKFIFITLFLVGNVFSVCLAQSYPYQKESIPVPPTGERSIVTHDT